jgi:hypothetical protein
LGDYSKSKRADVEDKQEYLLSEFVKEDHGGGDHRKLDRDHQTLVGTNRKTRESRMRRL